jgi:hypothetical protein
MRTLFGKNRVVLNKAQQNQPPSDVFLQQQSLKARLIYTNQRKHYPNWAALRNQKKLTPMSQITLETPRSESGFLNKLMASVSVAKLMRRLVQHKVSRF